MSIPDKKPLRAVPDDKVTWRNDPDYFEKYYLDSNSKENLDHPTPVRLDKDVAIELSKLIASKNTPYETISQFIRDAVTKGLRYQAEKVGSPAMQAAVQRVWAYQESEHRTFLAERNKKLLEQQKKAFENAQTVKEWRKILELCDSAKASFEGKQLGEMEAFIGELRRRLSE